MKKKVLVIVENLPVPFDKRVWNEASALKQNGYDVSVLCPRGKGYEKGFETIDGVHIYRHPMCKEGSSIRGYLWEYICVLFWEFIYTFWIYLRRGFRIIQGCNPPDFIFLIALPYKLLGVKYIFDHHDVSPELYLSKYGKMGFLYKIQLWLEGLTYRSSDVVMCTNGSYKALAISRGGCNPEDVFIVRNGPDPATFRPVPLNPALKYGKAYLVGYVGTMNVQDGLDILLDVASYIKALGRRDIHFTCVGGGPALKKLQKMVQDKRLQEMVNLTGRIPDKEMLEILSTADVCANPDRPCVMNDISTMIKVMEYMALSKPIVQFDLTEGRFSAGEASLYADPGNMVQDFAAKILWLLENPAARTRMGKFGRKRVEQELAWSYSVDNLLAAYSRALGRDKKTHHASATVSELNVKRAAKNLTAKPDSFGGNQVLVDHFRCPSEFLNFQCAAEMTAEPGFFRFGPEGTCFGRSTEPASKDPTGGQLTEVRGCVNCEGTRRLLPFDPQEVVANLREERYIIPKVSSRWEETAAKLKRDAYYAARPLLGVTVRKHLQKAALRGWDKLSFPKWPVDTTVEQLFDGILTVSFESRDRKEIPFIWFWPNGASSCVTITHDVETKAGAEWSCRLMDIDDAHGIKASFQIVPEGRYPVTESFLNGIRERGFEVSIQDLNHDGRLFRDCNTFLRRAKAINRYASAWGSRGFRAAALYRNPQWYEALEISYDMSIPNVAHLEPQRGGCCTVFPYFIGKILEIPLTTTQDYSLFHILNDYSIDLWKRQIEIIQNRNGLVSFIVHPDYIIAKRPRETYLALLEYLTALRSAGDHWFAVPGEIDAWWRARSNMRLVLKDGCWVIEGPESHRARVAFAQIDRGRVTYTILDEVPSVVRSNR